MESLGAQKLSEAIFFASGPTRRLADSGAGKKPLRLIFALLLYFQAFSIY